MKRSQPDFIVTTPIQVLRSLNTPGAAGNPAPASALPLLHTRLSGETEAQERIQKMSLALQGDIDAQYFMGHCFEVGSHGLPRNIETALAWYERAALLGHANALRKVAAIHDLQAREGQVDSQFKLGMFFAYGKGVARDFQFAASWLKSAADKGHTLAMFNFGTLLETGNGVGRNLQLALEYYRLAAAQGCVEAKYALARLSVPSRSVNQRSSEPEHRGEPANLAKVETAAYLPGALPSNVGGQPTTDQGPAQDFSEHLIAAFYGDRGSRAPLQTSAGEQIDILSNNAGPSPEPRHVPVQAPRGSEVPPTAISAQASMCEEESLTEEMILLFEEPVADKPAVAPTISTRSPNTGRLSAHIPARRKNGPGAAYGNTSAGSPSSNATSSGDEAQWNSSVEEGRFSAAVSRSQWPSFCAWLMQAHHVAAVHLMSDLTDATKVQELLTALDSRRSCTELKLNDCKIRPEGVSLLCEALKFDSQIAGLDLSGNALDDDDAARIAQALEGTVVLKALNLGFNNIGKSGLLALADMLKLNSAIVDLDLRSNQLDPQSLMAFGRALQQNASLKKLNLAVNKPWSPKFRSAGENSARAWAEAVSLFAEGLKRNTSLCFLSLYKSDVDSAGAEALAIAAKDHPSLEQLDLSNNQIGYSAGTTLAAMLRSSSSLKQIYLGQNQLGSLGVAAIAGALKVNTSLTSLDVSLNHVDLGAVTEMANALESNSTLLSCQIREDYFVHQIGSNPPLGRQLRRIDRYLDRNKTL